MDTPSSVISFDPGCPQLKVLFILYRPSVYCCYSEQFYFQFGNCVTKCHKLGIFHTFGLRENCLILPIKLNDREVLYTFTLHWILLWALEQSYHVQSFIIFNLLWQERQDLGEALLSLNYLPSAGRLNVDIIKAKQLLQTDMVGGSGKATALG